MTEKEKNKLISLLKKLKAEGLVPPKTPYDIWLELSTLLPLPAVEVLVTRTGRDFLLTERHDQHWDGWHIPGGFILAGESIGEACNRLALKELGIKVKFKRFLFAYAWKDHPYGYPISLICLCQPLGQPKIGKFFKVTPQKTIARHREFLKIFLKQKNRILCL